MVAHSGHATQGSLAGAGFRVDRSSDHFDGASDARRVGQSNIGGERCLRTRHYGKRHVPRVIPTHIVAKRPHSRTKPVGRKPGQHQAGEPVESQRTLLLGQRTTCRSSRGAPGGSKAEPDHATSTCGQAAGRASRHRAGQLQLTRGSSARGGHPRRSPVGMPRQIRDDRAHPACRFLQRAASARWRGPGCVDRVSGTGRRAGRPGSLVQLPQDSRAPLKLWARVSTAEKPSS